MPVLFWLFVRWEASVRTAADLLDTGYSTE